MLTARASGRRLWRVIGALCVALLAVLALSARLGVEGVSWATIFEPDSVDGTIVLRARLGRSLLAAVVGTGLAASGVTFQTLVRNPLADPYILGVSGGAAVGAVIVMLVGATGGPSVAGGAFVGAVMALFLVYRLAVVRGQLMPTLALLSGVVFNAFAWAVILSVAALAHTGTTAEVLLWLMGALSPPEWSRLAFAALATAAGVAGLFAFAPRMNALALGEEGAHSVGVDVARTRKRLLVIASLLTGISVSVAGPIGFVGIIVPHAMRMWVGPDHRLLLPASALGGAVFLVACDLLTRLAFLPLGSEPPVGQLTAILGGPFFLVLLWRRRAQQLF